MAEFFGGIPFFNHQPVLVETDSAYPYLVKHNQLNISGQRPGKYLIAWAYTWSHSSISSQFISRIRLGNQYLINPETDGAHKQKPRSTGDVIPAFGFAVTDIGAGAQKIVLEFTTSVTGSVSRIHSSTIVVWRVG